MAERGPTPRGAPALLCVLLGLASAPAQQDQKKEAWRVDPYTGGDAEAAQKIGVVSYGPFVWATDHTTEDIEKVIGGGVALRFSETAHFKVGTALPGYAMPTDRDARTRLTDEIKRLQKLSPKFKPDTKTVDPWLRHHLFEQRLEELYEDFASRLSIDKAQPVFPGMKGKFLVLLVEKESSMGRYAVRYLKQEGRHPHRHYFAEAGALLYGAALEYLDGPMRSDVGMWCQMVNNMTHNLVAAYKGYCYQAPIWFEEGLGHYFARRVDQRFNTFSFLKDDEQTLTKEWDWKPKVRARVGHDTFPRADAMLGWQAFSDMSFADHMFAWSRVEWLMGQGDDKLALYLDTIKGRQTRDGQIPTAEQIRQYDLDGLQKAWGLDPKALDEQWKRYVLAKYPAR